MKISKYGKTYDTRDGSEQHFEDKKDAAGRELKRELRSDTGRWQDDGGPVSVAPTAAAAPKQSTPVWSVLSMRAMKAALAAWLKGEPAREQRAIEHVDSERTRAVAAADDKVQTAHRNRYRNAWENT